MTQTEVTIHEYRQELRRAVAKIDGYTYERETGDWTKDGILEQALYGEFDGKYGPVIPDYPVDISATRRVVITRLDAGYISAYLFDACLRHAAHHACFGWVASPQEWCEALIAAEKASQQDTEALQKTVEDIFKLSREEILKLVQESHAQL